VSQTQDQTQHDQSMIEHLGELRKRLIRTLWFFLGAIILTFCFVDQIYDFLVQDAYRFFTDHKDFKLAVLGPGDILKVYFTVAGLAAVFLTIPFMLYQAWQFVRPALHEREAQLALRFLPLVVAMLFAGVLFGYYFIFPLLFDFLYQLGSEKFQIAYTADKYFGFLANIVLPFGLIFEMPVATMFLTRIGILTPGWLVKVRKYAYFAMVVIASMISPPDFVSHLSVAVPMILLYEAAVTVSKWTYKKRQQALAAYEADYADEVADDER